MRPTLLLTSFLLFAACAPANGPTVSLPSRAPGSNQVLRAVLAGHPDVEVIISDVVIPPNSTIPRHYHPGQEFLYMIEGTSVHVEEGKPDLHMKAGDSYAIPPRAIHAPRGGPNGARAIVFRVHQKNQPERILVPK